MFIRAFLPMLLHDLPSKPVPDPQSSREKGLDAIKRLQDAPRRERHVGERLGTERS
jgi:hypothetical protein